LSKVVHNNIPKVIKFSPKLYPLFQKIIPKIVKFSPNLLKFLSKNCKNISIIPNLLKKGSVLNKC
jgi:hypothetical protein